MRLNQPKSAGEKRKKHRENRWREKKERGGGLLGSTPQRKMYINHSVDCIRFALFFEPFVSSSCDWALCRPPRPLFSVPHPSWDLWICAIDAGRPLSLVYISFRYVYQNRLYGWKTLEDMRKKFSLVACSQLSTAIAPAVALALISSLL